MKSNSCQNHNSMPEPQDQKIAVLIPCLNEEKTIRKVILDFKRELPSAAIYVYDNNSTDQTSHIARQTQAEVRQEIHAGKGNVVRSMFRNIAADIYILVDGDDTHEAHDVHELLKPVRENRVDITVGNRLKSATTESITFTHIVGNKILRWVLNTLFHSNFQDILSGFRVMNKRFVKTSPILARGFEVETEMTIHALERGYTMQEVPIQYRARPQGSHSKIREFHDGIRILSTIFIILRDYRPVLFFSLFACLFYIPGLLCGYIVTTEYIATGLVLRLPTAVLAVGLMLVGVIVTLSGFIIATINKRFSELQDIIEKK